MEIIEDEITPELERITRELKKLSGMSIHIGIQGASGYDASGAAKEGAPADILTIANVNEFGATIKAKNVKNLAIPIAKKAIGKSPLDFPGLFFIRTSSGYVFGCISPDKPKKRKPSEKPLPKKNGDIEFLFILMESTTIPERSFIRAGYDNNQKMIEDMAAIAVQNVVFSGWDAETAANHIGMAIVGIIQMYMNQPFHFKKKGSITKATSNWPDNPLVETGMLRNSVTYRIEGGT